MEISVMSSCQVTLHQPDREVCVVPMSLARRDMECCLEHTLIVCMGGTRLAVSALEVTNALEFEQGISLACFTVHPFYPKNFLVIFDSHSTKDRILHDRPIKTQRFMLLLRQWSRLAQVSYHPLRFRVELSLEGLLIHAWSVATLSTILSPSSWIESFDESSTSRADLSAFRLVAWSFNPSAIPKAKTVIITKPEVLPDVSITGPGAQVLSKPCYSRESVDGLCYSVLIHLYSIIDSPSI